MNRAYLLAQVKFFLALVYVGSYLCGNLLFEFGYFEFLRKEFFKRFKPVFRAVGIEYRLRGRFFHRGNRQRVVDKRVGRIYTRYRGNHILGYSLIEQRVFVKHRFRDSEMRFGKRSVFARDIRRFFDRRRKITLYARKFFDFCADDRFYVEFDRVVGQFYNLLYLRDNARSVNILFRRRIYKRVLLRRDENLAARFPRRFHRRNGRRTTRVEVQKRPREKHFPAERHDGQYFFRFFRRRD